MKYCEFIYQLRAIEMAALIMERPHYYTEAELAVQFYTSESTIRRYKRYLREIGINIYSRNRLYSLHYSPNQLKELISRYLALSTREPVHQLKTIHEHLKEKTLLTFIKIIKAINQKHEIEIKYQKSKDDCYWRIITPLKIHQTPKAIYLVGLENGTVKFFFMDHVIDYRFPKRRTSADQIPSLEEKLSNPWGVFTGGERKPVRLLFEDSLKDYLKSRLYQEDQEIWVREDGVELKMTVRINYEFISWVMGWGDKVRVLEPEELKEEVIQRSKAILKIYE